MSVTKLLIANRGEIAIRIARAAADMGLPCVAVHSEDDLHSLHVRMADEYRPLPGLGAAAYLDADAIIAAATGSGCDAIHPGYGFLAERADFAQRCAAAGLTFVGPDVAHLALFGDNSHGHNLFARLYKLPCPLHCSGRTRPAARGVDLHLNRRCDGRTKIRSHPRALQSAWRRLRPADSAFVSSLESLPWTLACQSGLSAFQNLRHSE